MTKTNKKSRKQLIIGSGIIIVAALCIFAYWLYVTYYPSTDNAYVQANIINVSPQASGYIKTILVKDNQYVHKGDLLLEIDPVNYDIPLDKAKQNYLLANQQTLNAKKQINNAQANIAKASSNYIFANKMAKRYANLYEKKAGSLQDKQKYKNQANQAKQALDQANSALEQSEINYEISKTQINIAQIGIDNASINKSYTKLYAPVTGYIGNLHLKSGQLIGQGQKLFVLIDDASWWVDVNYEETQISRIKSGQPATVSLDLYNHDYSGTVESISYASGSTYSLLPAQNASGNWVKVAQRFTVKVKIENSSKYPLRVGASANVSVNTTD